MTYFSNFPRVQYDFPDGVSRNINNISLRAIIAEEVFDTVTSFETYSVRDGDTPETLAFDFYDDVNLHWIIMLANNIMNVYRDWPMTTNQFDLYLRQKYGKVIVNDSEVVLNDEDYQTYIEFEGLPENNFTTYIHDSEIVVRPHHFEDENKIRYNWDTVTSTTISLPDVLPVSIYEYENKLNEAKRDIIIPKSYLVEQIKKEFREMLNE